MSSFEVKTQEDHTNSKRIFIALVLTGAFIWTTVIISYFFYLSTSSQEQTLKEDTSPSLEYQEYQVEALETLTALEWTNKDKTTCRIPIKIAKQRVIQQYKNK